jgi:hypothetical protein
MCFYLFIFIPRYLQNFEHFCVRMPKQEGAPEDNVPPEFTLPLVDHVKQAGEDVELSVTGNTAFF